jgi:hypothetical protein
MRQGVVMRGKITKQMHLSLARLAVRRAVDTLVWGAVGIDAYWSVRPVRDSVYTCVGESLQGQVWYAVHEIVAI